MHSLYQDFKGYDKTITTLELGSLTVSFSWIQANIQTQPHRMTRVPGAGSSGLGPNSTIFWLGHLDCATFSEPQSSYLQNGSNYLHNFLHDSCETDGAHRTILSSINVIQWCWKLSVSVHCVQGSALSILLMWTHFNLHHESVEQTLLLFTLYNEKFELCRT